MIHKIVLSFFPPKYVVIAFGFGEKAILKNAEKVKYPSKNWSHIQTSKRECEKWQIKPNDTNHWPTVNLLGTIC